MSLRWLGLGCVVILHALAACGDDGGGDQEGGGAGSASGDIRLPSTLERDTLLSELSADDVADLCGAIEAAFGASISDQEAKRLSCTLLALLTSAQPGQGGQATVDRAACEQAVQDCLEADFGEPVSETRCEPSRVQTEAQSCSVTVGEYRDCLDGSLSQLEAALDSFTCEALASGEVSALDGNSDLSAVPACQAIQSECPGLLDEGGSSESPSESGCDDTCRDADDDFCDDGGEGSHTAFCGLGTDCTDCGPR